MIGIDLGGTDIKAGLVDAQLNITAQVTLPTQAATGPDGVVERIVAIIEELRGLPQATAAAVGIGTPGPLSPTRGIVYRSANLPGWRDVPLRDNVARRVGMPVTIDNDANVAAYGEYRADPEIRNLVLLTLGTGVGAGAVVDGRILHGQHENASEWGHMIVHPGGIPCKCGQRGCLEMYASASNIAKRTAQQIRAGAESSLDDPDSISGRDVADAAKSGDALANKVWDEACHALAIACINIQHALNPQRVLLGGGMGNAGEFLLDAVRRHYRAMHWNLCDDLPEIRLAILGNNAGIIGAAAMARDLINSTAQG